ncbi:hypothetical protein, partial [Flavobacterium sp.]|uniref:hypothetical protein n=1 Tax=Flavobacterium sp. TaxID=239 RepID=UPI0025E3F416
MLRINKKYFIKTLLAFCLVTLIVCFAGSLTLVSCDRPVCKNKNLIFDKYSPETKEYKIELIKQFAKVDKSKLTYWMDTYQEENNTKYINVHIQGDGLC